MSETHPSIQEIRDAIRDVPDFPKPGVLFKDITPVLANASLLRGCIHHICEPYRNQRVDAVVGIDARGFIFATGVALELNAGFVPVRKSGKLPYKTFEADYDLEYGTNRVAIHEDALTHSSNVLLVDDLLATGGTAAAAIQLLDQLNVHVIGIEFLIELDFLKGRDKFPTHPVRSLINY